MTNIQYTKVTWYSKTLALALFVAMPFLGFWAGIKYQVLKESATGSNMQSSTTPIVNSTGNNSTQPTGGNRASYTNEDYGFRVSYPNSLKPETSFETYYHLSSSWRSGASPDSSGKAIITIPSFRIRQNDAYPRYFSAEVRIGASRDAKDVAACYNDDENSAGIPSTSETINGISFRKYILGSAGMMQYMTGESYRVVHNNTCYAIEQLQTGSTYRDATTSKDISDDQLDSYYNSLADIVKSFRFTK